MPYLYLVRHAATQPNDDEAATWPLSAHGQQQAQLLAAHPCWREVQRIISSSEEKALATVLPAAARHNLPLDGDDGLRELRRPAVWTSQEVYEQTATAVFAQPDQSVAGWEAAASVRERMNITIARLMQAHAGQTVAIVSHGLALSIWLAHLRTGHMPTIEAWRAVPFAAVACVDLDARELVRPFAGVDSL